MQDSPLEVTVDGSGLTGTDIDRAARRLGIFDRYGFDPAGEIVGRPPRYYRGMDDFTGQPVNDAELDAEILRIEEEKRRKKRARWTTTPREIIREGPSPLVLSTTPDVAYTPRGSAVCPIPYATCARPTSPQNFANTVRATNQRIMVLRSRELITHGAEQGVALGVASGTINGPVDPLQHSTTVRAEGSYIIRDQDAVWMNDFNNLGVIQMDGDRSLVAPANSPDAPADGDDEEGVFDGLWDGAKDAWQATKDAASSAAQAIADFDREHGRVLTRGVGVVQAVGGAAEAIGGGALATGGAAATPTGVGTAPGIGAMALGGALWVNGWDNAWTGLQTAWTGEFQHTMTAQAAGAAAEALGADPATAESIRDGTDLASGALSIGGGIAAGARSGARETVETGLRESAETASREIDEVAEATAEQTGRVTRRVSKRLQYLGSTPDKYRTTGKAVRDRMRSEGTLRYDADLGEDVFLAENGQWYPVNRSNVHMGHHPVDAVDWWNSTGRYFGAKSPEVRAWMRNSENYRFEYGPLNSGRGGATTSRYLDPVQ